MTNREKLEAAAQRCAACEGCTLCKTSTHLVYGTGNPEASLVFVGEAPGEKEDLSGIPFVGPAGQLFDLYLDAVACIASRCISAIFSSAARRTTAIRCPRK